MTQLDTIIAELAEIKALIMNKAAASSRPATATAPASGGAVAPADAADLDGDHGDPVVKFDPKRWQGQPMAGRRYSQTSPEDLGAVASLLEWKLANPLPGKERFAEDDRRDCARAKGWAKRLREGWGQGPAPAPQLDADGNVPF